VAITAHVYQLYIAATPEQVWTAITDSEWTQRYFHGVSFVDPPVRGARYLTQTSSGRDAVDGVIEELEPPTDGRPGRFVQTWHILYDADLAAEPPSRVEWTVEAAGEGITRVRLVHGDLAASPLTWANVKDGWVWILDGLKTLLETGRVLPAAGEPSVTSAPTDADWHRRQGVEATNAAFELLAADRDADADEDLLRSAYAAAYHWQRAAGVRPENEGRASYLIARALLATGRPEAALRAADRCFAICTANGLADFDLAYAHEARARALRALGRQAEAEEEWLAATAVPISNEEDAAILGADLAIDPVA
jgi:uncharacterized protein YndB with AHSA1/START domain